MNIIVTGGASGLGEALVKRLPTHHVWILDVKRPDTLASKHHFVSVDLSDYDSIITAIGELPESIQGLANVAGIAQAEDPKKVIAVNFLGLRTMVEQLSPRIDAGGSIVNVSSIAGSDWVQKYDRLKPLLETASFADGLTWCDENPETFVRDPYGFSKRAVTAYTMRSAQTALNANLRVNSVSPGPIETPLLAQFESMMGEAHSEWMKSQTGRIATAMDIAEVIQALLTEPMNWLNGVDIPVDGGYTAGVTSGWIDFQQSPAVQARLQKK
jgi:NAD(P)-dependent dehydrogenase (short-subunit alcohol dehydrogenase family)